MAFNYGKTTAAEAAKNPHTYGAGTRLSSAYTAGRNGLPLPPHVGRGSVAAKAWRIGRNERVAALKGAVVRS